MWCSHVFTCEYLLNETTLQLLATVKILFNKELCPGMYVQKVSDCDLFVCMWSQIFVSEL